MAKREPPSRWPGEREAKRREGKPISVVGTSKTCGAARLWSRVTAEPMPSRCSSGRATARRTGRGRPILVHVASKGVSCCYSSRMWRFAGDRRLAACSPPERNALLVSGLWKEAHGATSAPLAP